MLNMPYNFVVTVPFFFPLHSIPLIADDVMSIALVPLDIDRGVPFAECVHFLYFASFCTFRLDHVRTLSFCFFLAHFRSAFTLWLVAGDGALSVQDASCWTAGPAV